jgi:tetratricopeptide (TPR) repeat protein
MKQRCFPYILTLFVSVIAVQGQAVTAPAPGKASYDKGSTALKNGDIESAIINYSRAIELEPKNANAYGGRGAAKRTKGDIEGALADLNKSIELDANVQSAYYARAWVNLILKHGDDAYADATKVLSFNQTNAIIFPSHVLIAYFGLRQAKCDWEADTFLRTWALKLLPSSWTVQITRYLRREITDAQLFSSASGNKAMVEARSYVGLDQSLSGKRDAALTNLRWVAAKADRRTFEYTLALAETRRLETPAPSKPLSKY